MSAPVIAAIHAIASTRAFRDCQLKAEGRSLTQNDILPAARLGTRSFFMHPDRPLIQIKAQGVFLLSVSMGTRQPLILTSGRR